MNIEDMRWRHLVFTRRCSLPFKGDEKRLHGLCSTSAEPVLETRRPDRGKSHHHKRWMVSLVHSRSSSQQAQDESVTEVKLQMKTENQGCRPQVNSFTITTMSREIYLLVFRNSGLSK